MEVAIIRCNIARRVAGGPTRKVGQRPTFSFWGHSNAVDGNTRIARLIGPPLEAMGFTLVRVRFGGGRRPILQIMAERADGTMTVQDCADVSRAVSAVLDVEDPIPGEYMLEVSSPGIDRPLTRLVDFERFKGFEARIELSLPQDGRKRFRGRLQGLAEGEEVQLADADGSTVLLPFHAISDAKLVLTDDLIAASLRGEVPGGGPPPDDDGVEFEVEGDEAGAEGEAPVMAAAAAPAKPATKKARSGSKPARSGKSNAKRSTANR